MKIEIGESLGYSYLRHVKKCWLVQTNWKGSEHWEKSLTDEELEESFFSMREIFDPDGSVFKGTRDCSQFLKQGEIDVVGVGQDGSIHAMEVAFHEAGLNYTGGAAKRVLKKLLRTMLILNAYHPEDTARHIYFVSPKVHRGVQQPLAEMFESLDAEYQTINWHLLTNEEFTSQLLVPTLEKAESVADTSELFVRSAKLLELAGVTAGKVGGARVGRETPTRNSATPGIADEATTSDTGQIQPLVRNLMETLLDDFPSLLDDADLVSIMDNEYCKKALGLRIGNYPLLRGIEDGRKIGGHGRYGEKVYGDKFYVCSQWWKSYHLANAASLLRFVDELIGRRAGHPGLSALQKHRAELQAYIGYP